MEYTYLGQSGLKVSRLCLGTMNIGGSTDEKESFRMMDAALDAGINFFDTADMYGRPNSGYTERIIGRWFKQGGGRREKVILATKCYNDMEEPLDGPNNVGNSAWRMRRHVDDCLRRLQTDHIDVLYMHEYDPHCTWNEVWATYESMIAQGKVIYAAGSNFGDRHLWQAQHAAEKRNFIGMVCMQQKYNLIDRLVEVDMLPSLKDLGIGLLAWSPLCGGVLSGSSMSSSDGRRNRAHARRDIAAHPEQLAAFSQLCQVIGASEANVATAWLLAKDGVTGPVIGPRTTEQLLDTVKAVDIKLDVDTVSRLEEIFPGPGASPNAYRR